MAKSSGLWCQRQRTDIYVKLAQQKNYRSRAAFKLLQLHEKYNIFISKSVIVDLGAAPGSWSQVIAELLGSSSKIVAVDQTPMEPIKDVLIVQKNLLDEDAVDYIINLVNSKADVVVSDLAPNLSGIDSVDMARAVYLWEVALNFALKILKPKGKFLVKVFQCNEFSQYTRLMKTYFDKVVIFKPLASRAESREVYCFAKGLIKQKEAL